jgi:hypothetical protein
MPLLRDAAAIVAGLVVGVLSGTMGIGGGILLVPIMAIGFGFTQHLAQGTSLAAIVPTSIVGAKAHDDEGNVDRRAALWVGAGGLLGTLAGTLLAAQLPREILVRLFGALLIYAAYRIWSSRARK